MYNNINCVTCDATTGTPITVTAGTTVSNIDFALSVGGGISGTITDADTGLPIVNINIEIYNAAGELIALGGTDLDGNYDVNRGLPTGTYYAVTNNLHGYLNELYKDNPCLFTCDRDIRDADQCHRRIDNDEYQLHATERRSHLRHCKERCHVGPASKLRYHLR